MAALTRSRIVAWFKWAAAGTALFEYEDANELGRPFVLDEVAWQDMGKPERITITIEPGDLLND